MKHSSEHVILGKENKHFNTAGYCKTFKYNTHDSDHGGITTNNERQATETSNTMSDPNW